MTKIRLWICFGMLGLGVLVSIVLYDSSNGLEIRRDVVYGRIMDTDLKLDIYRMKSTKGLRPSIVCVHGGGWVEGSKADFADLCRGLAAEGYVVASVDYRLMKGGKNAWPAAFDDVQRAVRWLRAHADEWGIDPKRMGAVGGSAGGHLVSLLGVCDTRDNSVDELATYSSKVQCVVNLSGPCNLAVPFPVRPEVDLERVRRDFVGNSPVTAREASPLTYVNSASAPFLIFQGQDDPWVLPEQARWLNEALQGAGVEVKLIVFPGEKHSFTKSESLKVLVEELKSFLNRHLKQTVISH